MKERLTLRERFRRALCAVIGHKPSTRDLRRARTSVSPPRLLICRRCLRGVEWQ